MAIFGRFSAPSAVKKFLNPKLTSNPKLGGWLACVGVQAVRRPACGGVVVVLWCCGVVALWCGVVVWCCGVLVWCCGAVVGPGPPVPSLRFQRRAAPHQAVLPAHQRGRRHHVGTAPGPPLDDPFPFHSFCPHKELVTRSIFVAPSAVTQQQNNLVCSVHVSMHNCPCSSQGHKGRCGIRTPEGFGWGHYAGAGGYPVREKTG